MERISSTIEQNHRNLLERIGFLVSVEAWSYSRMRSVCVFVPLIVLVACSTSPGSPEKPNLAASSGVAGSSVAGGGTDAGRGPALSFLDLARQAEAVVVARLAKVDFSAEAQDRFLTSSEWQVRESLRGSLRQGETIRVRFPLGREPGGDWRWIGGEAAISPDDQTRMKPGDTFLLMLSRGLYEQQARARSGSPLPGVTGAGFGLHRITGDEIGPGGSFEPPRTLQQFKQALQEK
jgi:hypothetical protein